MNDEVDKPIMHIGPLSGPEGNAWVILGRAREAMRAAGRKDEWGAISKDAMSGNYEHLLDVIDQHFTVVGTRYAADDDWRST